jgi:hypothetical protein
MNQSYKQNLPDGLNTGDTCTRYCLIQSTDSTCSTIDCIIQCPTSHEFGIVLQRWATKLDDFAKLDKSIGQLVTEIYYDINDMSGLELEYGDNNYNDELREEDEA